MIIDMGYWTKVLKRLSIFSLTVCGIYLALKLAVYYMPFLIAFVISLLVEPIIRFLCKKLKLNRKASAIIVLAIISSLIVGLLTIRNNKHNIGIVKFITRAKWIYRKSIYTSSKHNR